MKVSKSSWEILPAGPVPETLDKSTPASLALRLTAGEAKGLEPEEVGCEIAGTDDATGSGLA